MKDKYGVRGGLLVVLIILKSCLSVHGERQNCYDSNGKAVRCYPEFINAAHSQPVIVTNTCGDLESEFCVQTNIYASNDYGDNRLSKCDVCDARRRDKSHPAEYLTDYNVKSNLTWWQSDTMENGIQYPNSVNLTIHLGKSFDITYVQVKFYSPRPESFSIWKRVNESSEWQPYQYYSANCENIYSAPTRGIITRENETVALCTDEFSDIAPLSGGSVAFSTLEGRPSAYNFENSPDLKEWVTATDIRIILNRLNTFGDEVFGDPKVLRSYFYAISDISIGARCKCNGHANECTRDLMDSNFEEKYRCRCEHNTDGVDCEKCAPFFNDRPWAPATYADANECLPCNCNGLSNKCVFNQTLYDQTGHGGYCIDCQRNTDGAHCEYCKYSYYRRESTNECVDCNCHRDGALSAQCDPTGKCKCKPGVVGEKCDRCAPNHYEISAEGCKPCQCNEAGSFDNPPICDSRDGQCRCKQNVEGRNCDRCKPGFFNLDANLTIGCLPCFCFGHSSDCKSSTSYYEIKIESSAELENLNEWTASDSEGRSIYVGSDESASNGVFVFSQDKDVWFDAPARHLGDLRMSYNQRLTFFLKFTQSKSSMSRQDLILANSHANLQIWRPFYDQYSSAQPDYFGQFEQEFSFLLSERDQWRPTLSARDFQRLLSNLTSIRIKSSLGGYTFLKSFKMSTAKPIKGGSSDSNLKQATWIEHCQCPLGHAGQFCEQCAHGYRREIIGGDAFVKCLPCQCNGHSVGGGCDQQTGKCECGHHTIGENCELCQEGYYGDALQGTPQDCKKCPCPNDGPCAEFYNYQSQSVDVVCLRCPTGTRGNLCDMCEDGWHQSKQDSSKCVKCDCNGNIDENAVGNCDQVTGECLRCVHNTTGRDCERCLDSYWGNALTDLKCHACECYPLGSNNPDSCKLEDGQCECKPNVIGRQCSECRPGFWNLTSGVGCTECQCNPLGSFNLICNPVTAQCSCRPGVTGLKCDQCLPLHFNFSSEGCQKCLCDSKGSRSQQCDLVTGKCECRSSAFGGDKCDRCAENHYNFTIGCQPCEECYGLVQNEVEKIRQRVSLLEDSLERIVRDTMTEDARIKSRELEGNLKRIKNDVNDLHKQFFENNELNATYKATIDHLDESITRLGADLKKLQRPLDTFAVKLEELAPLANKLNKTLGDIELQLTMNSIIQGQKQTQWNAIEQRLAEEPDEEASTTNEARMKKLAQNGRASANQQKKQVDDINKQLNACVIDSSKAMDHLNEILLRPPLRLAQLEADYDYELISETAKKLTSEAKRLKSDLDKQYEEARVSTDKLKNFKFNHDSFDKDMITANEKLKDIASFIKNEKTNAENLQTKAAQLNESSEGAILNAERAINLAKIKNGDINQLLERSERVANRSREAKELSEEAFKNASKTLDILENFNSSLSAQKERANEAKKLEASIESNTNEARTLYFNVSSGLDSARSDVAQATNNAILMSQQIASANKSLSRINEESENLRERSSNLLKNVEKLTNEHDDSKESVGSMTSKYSEIPTRLSNIQSQSEDVLKRSQALFSNVNNAQETLDTLKDVNLSENRVSRSEIARLQAQYDEVSRELESLSNVDAQLNELDERYESSRRELESYERELPKLRQNIAELTLLLNTMNCKNRM